MEVDAVVLPPSCEAGSSSGSVRAQRHSSQNQFSSGTLSGSMGGSVHRKWKERGQDSQQMSVPVPEHAEQNSLFTRERGEEGRAVGSGWLFVRPGLSAGAVDTMRPDADLFEPLFLLPADSDSVSSGPSSLSFLAGDFLGDSLALFTALLGDASPEALPRLACRPDFLLTAP